MAAKKSFGEKYRTFGQAYEQAAQSLSVINAPEGLEKYHQVLTDGTRKLSEASLRRPRV